MPPPEVSEPKILPSAPRQQAGPAHGAVIGLIEQANQAERDGDLPKALAIAERAQSIDPRAVEAYVTLASIHRRMGNPDKARQIALRGMPYASDAQSQRELQYYIERQETVR